MPESAARSAPSLPSARLAGASAAGQPLDFSRRRPGAHRRGCRCGAASFRTTPAVRACTAGRASLWLGPDEYLLIAPAAEPAATIARALAAALGPIAACDRRCEPSPGRHRNSRPAGGAYPERRLPLGFGRRGISGGRLYAHAVREGRYRAVAHARRRLPDRGVAFVQRLCREPRDRDRARLRPPGLIAWMRPQDPNSRCVDTTLNRFFNARSRKLFDGHVDIRPLTGCIIDLYIRISYRA